MMKDYEIDFNNHEIKILKPKVKCRWCEWETPRFRSHNGKRLSGYSLLKRHVEFCHPEEWAKIEKEILEAMNGDSEFWQE